MKKIAKLSDLTPDPQNANSGTERGQYMVEHSLESYGAGRSILADSNGVVIAGNKTLQAAADMGLPVEVIQSDGKKLIVVQRTDLDLLTDKAARELAYADNRASEVGLAWDTEQLLKDMDSGIDLESFFFDWELDTLTGKASDEFDPNAHWEGMPEFEQDAIKTFHSMTIHFKTEQHLLDFARLVRQTITPKTKYIYYPEQQKEDLTKLAVVDES